MARYLKLRLIALQLDSVVLFKVLVFPGLYKNVQRQKYFGRFVVMKPPL